MTATVAAPFAPGPDTPGWLDWFDVRIFHTSGGKDSQTAMRHSMRAFTEAGDLDRVAVLHLVLDKRDTAEPRIEWQQVPELAAQQAARHGIPLSAGGGWLAWDTHLAEKDLTSRDQWAGQLHYARRDFDGDLLDDIATRRKRDKVAMRGWPTNWTRYCTSDWKTAVGRAFTEMICKQIRAERGLTRPVRVLQVMGFRAEESDHRAGWPTFGFVPKVSAMASRHVWQWLPIHRFTWGQVWQDIRESGIPYHPTYDQGLSRLSCRHCIYASQSDLALSRRMSPGSWADYVDVEAALDDPFQQDKPLALVEAAPGPAGFDVHWLTCPQCGVPVLADVSEAERACPTHAARGAWQLPRPRRGAGRRCVQVEALFDV